MFKKVFNVSFFCKYFHILNSNIWFTCNTFLWKTTIYAHCMYSKGWKKIYKSTTSYIHIYIRMKIQHVRVLVVLNTTVETMNDKFLKNKHYIEYTYLLALLYTCSIWLIVVEVKLCGKQVDRLSTNIIWQSHCKGSVTLDKREQNVFFDSF